VTNDFSQCHISKGLDFFKKRALEHWECTEYDDPNKPAIFLGIYHEEDIELFSNHKSYKILILGGSDYQNIDKIPDFSKTFCPSFINALTRRLEVKGIICKQWPTAVSNFDYIPSNIPLGDKIYVYSGNHKRDYLNDASGLNKGLYHECIAPLVDRLGEDRFIFAKQLAMEQLIDQVYSECFIFIKPNEIGGVTSMWELILMGRKTITSGTMITPNVINADLAFHKQSKLQKLFKKRRGEKYPSENVVGYQNIDNVIESIHQEEKYIGKINQDLSDSVRSLFSERPWQSLSFWLDD